MKVDAMQAAEGEKPECAMASVQVTTRVIKAFESDRQFIERLLHYGVPWRGVQERLKEELPDRLTYIGTEGGQHRI